MKSKLLVLLGLATYLPAAMADGAEAQAMQGGGLQSYLFLGVMFVVMYFVMIRPQSKRAKEHKNMLSKLATGDEVLTQGGLVGTIARDAGTFFMLTLSQGVEVPVQKQSVVQVLPKGTLQSI